MSDVSLKEHLEVQVRNLREHVDGQHADSLRALALATSGLHDRFEQVNQFRAQILEERGLFARQEVVTILADRISRLELAAANVAGRWWTVGLLSSAIGAGLGIILSRLF